MCVPRYVKGTGSANENIYNREENTAATKGEAYAGVSRNFAIFLERKEPKLHECQRGREIISNELQWELEYSFCGEATAD